ncbi:MAG: hypothetical protein IPP49_06275 [Saprospiraceae bacterium]|nr:hypothetical protein [Saprospiraceae bacterium]
MILPLEAASAASASITTLATFVSVEEVLAEAFFFAAQHDLPAEADLEQA